jgi:hypothetical protein
MRFDSEISGHAEMRLGPLFVPGGSDLVPNAGDSGAGRRQTFSGLGFGAPGASVGEVVFNTAMTGYQEILTDPSYAGQLVTLTAAHVGNTGVNAGRCRVDRVHCKPD